MFQKDLKYWESNSWNESWNEYFKNKLLTLVLDTFKPEHVYKIWSGVCLSYAGFTSHMRSHYSKQPKADFTQILSLQPTGNMYKFCDNISKLDNTAG